MPSIDLKADTYLQSKIISIWMIPLVLIFYAGQPALALSYPYEVPIPVSSDEGQATGILTLQVLPIAPTAGSVLTNFPAILEILVSRGGLPVQGVTVQFWMEGGSTDTAMHNAGLTSTDSSGYARLALQNQNTLDAGQYIWYASAYKAGFKGGSSQVVSFTVPFIRNENIPAMLGGTVTTDKKDYSIVAGIGASIIISGYVNNYHQGQPIILEITSPSGKSIQLVTFGTYLGEFKLVFKAGQNSMTGSYVVTGYYNNFTHLTTSFNIVK